jgi:bifunctional non-homologous end joining protein LigD
VVQEHSATRLHWDLRLERDGVLASWAVPNGIPDEPKQNRKAIHTEDHPLEYLEFEGEIPAGTYGAGTMRIWDRGTYTVQKWEPRKVEVTFHGEKLRGRYALFATDREGKDWMIHRMDPPEDPAREPMPRDIVPMLARAGKLPPAREDARYAYEVKWDGVRAIAYSEPGRLRFQSRNLNDITPRYPELTRLNRALSSHSAVLDGEIVAFDAEGRPSFGALQGRMHVTSESQVRRLARERPVDYVIFDLLWLDGHSLMGLPYTERRQRLAELDLDGEHWQVPEPLSASGNGRAVLAASREHGLEGIVAKRRDSVYEPGRRSGAWIKIKNVNREELVIGGWVPGTGRRRDRIGALLVGAHDEAGERTDGGDGDREQRAGRQQPGRPLRYAGRVGTGFTEPELDRLAGLLGPLERETSPFAPGHAKPPRESVFVEPRLVAEVEYSEWTKDGMLRAPSYKGLRDDKQARDVVIEEGRRADEEVQDVVVEGDRVLVEGREVRVSNPDKVLYPKVRFTKGDVIRYLVEIAPVLLPHLAGRPLTLKRYPDGVEGPHFFEKQCPSHRPDWVKTAAVRSATKTITYCLAEDVATLVWLGNLADLELHTSLSRVEAIDRPTMLVFDLDPGAPATIVECCEIGLWLRGMFDGLGLQTVVKTSGSKGLQVYLPLNVPDVTYDDTKPFARAVAETLEREAPDRVVSRMTKSLRGGKVLVDWSQNDARKTTVNVYSLRAKERPTVSTPVTWDEVAACAEARDTGMLAFDAGQILRRVQEQGDLFAPALSVAQRLPRM